MEHVGQVRQAEAAPTVTAGPQRESGDTSRATGPLSARDLVALQRVAGNGAVAMLLGRPRMVQRDGPPNATMPPPNSSQAPDTEVMFFEGKALRADTEVLYKILANISETRGIMAAAEFTGRLRNTGLDVAIKNPSARPGLYHDILKGMDDVNLRLDHERAEFCTKFESTGNEAARGLLEESKKRIEGELARLGITGDIMETETGSYPSFQLSNAEAANAMKTAARELIAPAKLVDKTGAESAEAFRKLGEAQKTDPFNLMTKALVEEDTAKRQRWMEANEEYEKVRRAKVAENQSLALYTDQPGAAAKLEALAAMDNAAFANDVGEKAKRRLQNIEEVKGEIGKKFVVWHQPHLRRVTLDQMKATHFQREAVDWKVRDTQRKEADDKMLFAVIAIGLGLLSALPTGGAGLMAGIAVAAGLAGAGLALYQVGEQVSQFSLATAANATDFDKAKAISDKDPEGMQLALDCVMALGDVFAAAAAFKALGGIVKAAKGGDVASAIKLAGAVDNVGIKGSTKSKIIGEAVAGLSGEAIESVGKTVAHSGGMSQAEYLKAMLQGVAEHSQFKGELTKAVQMLEHVQGRIPETARELVKSGKVRVFSEAALIDFYGPVKGKAKWQKLSYAGGFFDPKSDIVFIRSGNELGGPRRNAHP